MSLDKISVASWAKHHAWSTRSAEALTMAVETTFGCNPKDVSMLFFLHFIAGSEKDLLGAGSTITLGITGGCHRLVDELAAKFVSLGGIIRTGAPVGSIVQESSISNLGSSSTNPTGTTTPDLKEIFTSVTVTTLNREEYKSSYLIFAAPPTILKTIQFTPALMPEKQLLGMSAKMGSYIKAFLVYSQPFWRNNQQSGEAFIPPTNTLLDTVSFTEDASDPESGVFAIAAYITGPRAEFWAQKPIAERKGGIINSLVEFFGPHAAHPLYYVESNWSANPFSGGGPFAVIPPGVLQATFGILRLPIHRIHWAGSESSRESFGTMEGAVNAGIQAAFEVTSRFTAFQLLEQRRMENIAGVTHTGMSDIPTSVMPVEEKTASASPSLNARKDAGITELPAPSLQTNISASAR